jgi:hypothetical protein
VHKFRDKELVSKNKSTREPSASKLILFLHENKVDSVEENVIKQISNIQLLILRHWVKFELQDNGTVRALIPYIAFSPYGIFYRKKEGL